MRTKQRNNLAETARHERVAQNTDVYAVKARNYKGLRRGSPVFCRNNWHIHHAKSGGGQILICVAGRGFYQEWGRAAVRRAGGARRVRRKKHFSVCKPFGTKKSGPFPDLIFLSYVPRIRLRLLGDVAQGGEGHGVVDGHLREHLAVDLDAGHLQTMHKGGVVHAVELAGGGDAGDPQLAEIPLLQPAAHIGVGQGLHDGLVGHLEVLALGAPVALGHLQDLISSLARHHRAFYSSHCKSLLF